jgi:HD-like signal output (HDOD) protein
MIISKSDIIKKISSIPPLPQSVKETIDYLKAGDLQKAADSANSDIVLKQKISSIVNSAYFGFSKKLTDIRVMFSAMGLEMAKGVVLSYMVSLLAPKEWKIFKNLNFKEFQSAYLANSKEAIILETDEATYKKYSDAIALIPATICLVDELLGEKKKKVDLLIESSGLDYGKILKRFTGMSLFELAALVAKKWELDEYNIKLIKYVECNNCKIYDKVLLKLSAVLHLEFFYLVSKPQFFDLNSFIAFNPKVIEIAQKNYERKINEE